MTPRIALDLNHDQIVVLTRGEDGTWLREGIVPLEVDDLADRLEQVRLRAIARVGADATSILIVPDSQILYTSLERDDRDPRVTIRTFLKGRTPYDVDDLTFEFVQKGDRLQVAVVATETLLEAATFASEYGFRPVRVVGDPQTSVFPGRPDFGPTSVASDLLGGAQVAIDLSDGFDARPAPPLPEDAEAEGPKDDTFVAVLNRDTAGERTEPSMPPSVPLPTPPVPATADQQADPPRPVAPSVPRITPTPPTPVGAAEQDAVADTGGAAATALPEAAPEANPTPEGPDIHPADTNDPPAPLPGDASSERDPEPAPVLLFRHRSTGGTSSPATAPVPSGRLDAPSSGPVGGFAERPRAGATATPRITLLGPAPSEPSPDEAPWPRRGVGRMALLLTILLLLALGAIGTWSLMTPTEEAAPVALPAPPLAPEEPTESELARAMEAETPPEEEAPTSPAVDMPDTTTNPSAKVEDPATDVEAQSADSETAPDDRLPGETTYPDPAIATLDAGPAPRSETSPIPSPETETADDINVAATDPEVARGGAVTSPPADLPGDTFGPQASPAPAEAEAEAEIGAAEEQVEPSVEGTPAPGGYLVVAGRPDVVPPQRPTNDVPAVAPSDVEPVVEPEAEPEAEADALRGIRPVPRPEDAAARVEETQPEEAPQDVIAQARPRPRPETIAAAARIRAGADAAVAEAEAQQSAAVAAAAAAAAASLASRAATAAPAPVAAAPAQAAAQRSQSVVTPQAAPEPAQAAVSRQVIRSTEGSVARAATQANALSLRETSLIGVYGQSDARRALVRLSNGRYVKVKVGDQLERGRVTAIGDGELRYQRGGRNIVLELPRG